MVENANLHTVCINKKLCIKRTETTFEKKGDNDYARSVQLYNNCMNFLNNWTCISLPHTPRHTRATSGRATQIACHPTPSNWHHPYFIMYQTDQHTRGIVRQSWDRHNLGLHVQLYICIRSHKGILSHSPDTICPDTTVGIQCTNWVCKLAPAAAAAAARKWPWSMLAAKSLYLEIDV